MEHIKVNLPATLEDYKRGNGEGCFFLVDEETKAAYDSDAEGGEYWGVLDNDSFYYLELLHGERLPIEMRGTLRPVVPYDYLVSHYEINAEFFGTDDGGETPKYCPLCGNNYPEVMESASGTWGVHCGFCNCSIVGYETKAAAVKQWNHRFDPER